MSRRADLELLGLPARPTLAELKQRYHEQVQRLHPDKGGDVEEFQAVAAAYDRLRSWLSQPQPCQRCQGAGSVALRSGFYTTTVRCPKCRGRKTEVP